MPQARHPRQEAQDVTGAAYDARVLEPSPPSVTVGEFADDPPAAGDRRPDTKLLTPADDSWQRWVDDHPGRSDWAADRWLADHRRLGPAPDDLVEVRDRLHTVLTNVITPARYRATGRIAARWTRGGFGTPFFLQHEQDTQVRIEGDHLVVQQGDGATGERLSTVGAAAELVLGHQTPDMQWTRDLTLHDVPSTADPDADVSVDAATAAFLGDWFGFATTVLERLRADDASVEASRPQLWPEHFDPAIELLPDTRRASYGFSPGDGGVPEPYVYVAVWYGDDVGIEKGQGLWTATSFPGAVLRLSELQDVDDQVAFALTWLRERRDALAAA